MTYLSRATVFPPPQFLMPLGDKESPGGGG